MNRIIKVMALILCALLVVACAPKKPEVADKTVEYKANDTVMKGYIAYDANVKGKRPGILVIHEWWGQSDFVKERARALAKAGYTALAVDMYGNAKQATDNKAAAEYAREVTEHPDVMQARFMAALNALKQDETVDPEKIAVIGYSFGGHVALEMARAGADLKGVVTFYGGLLTKQPAKAGAIKAKILICQGEKDWYVPAIYVTEFNDEMKKAKADYKMITYKDAEHGFANPDANKLKDTFKMHLGYDEKAYKQSWEDMLQFFKTIFGK